VSSQIHAIVIPTRLPTREDITDENRAVWAETLGVPPEHVETYLFDLPATGASHDDRNRD
jgi:hypothetical protein